MQLNYNILACSCNLISLGISKRLTLSRLPTRIKKKKLFHARSRESCNNMEEEKKSASAEESTKTESSSSSTDKVQTTTPTSSSPSSRDPPPASPSSRHPPPASPSSRNPPPASSSADDSDSSMDKIRKFFEQRLHIFESSNSAAGAEKLLHEATLDGIVEYIKEKKVTKIITMAGAGISTSAGIPDFRSPKSGLYHNLDKYNLPHPQAIFELDFFRTNPEPFFVLAKELLPEGYKPTPCHYFVRLLQEKGLLVRHYTQNIDTLERVAGVREEMLVEAHGTFHTGRCLDCRVPYDLTWMKERIREATIPKCEECSEGVVKPDIVFFGEMLPDRFHKLIEHDFPEAELLIIMGSSLLVQPFASLVDRVRPNCPRLLINKEKVGVADRLTRFLGLCSGMNYESSSNRDVAWLGDCDEGCTQMAEKLGWGDELKELIARENERLDKETAELKDLIDKKRSSLASEKASTE